MLCGQEEETSDFINFELMDKVNVQWDSINDLLVLTEQNLHLKEDSLTIAKLISLISDTTQLNLRVCSKTEPLVKGDLTFLLLYKLQLVPIFSCFKGQFDVFPPDCDYPDGVLDVLHKRRSEIVKRLKNCM